MCTDAVTVGAHYLALLHFNEDIRHGLFLIPASTDVERLVSVDVVKLKD